MKQFTARIQTKVNKIRHSMDPVQSKSSPMLISVSQLEMARVSTFAARPARS